MFDRSTRLFLRWRDRGDPRALGELFDRTAPDLLRLGLHLIGNVVDAEDLLQSTFLAAIESAPRFAKGSRVEPWLAGILTNRAHAERRRKQRSPENGIDGDDRAALDVAPDDRAVGRELGAAAKKALDELREPFRQPTVLRYVHGLEPAEIALLLNRSPGTVRAQIHRGLEQARRSLPAGLLAFGVVTASAGRGLAAVRLAVLQHAANVTTTTAAAATTAAVVTTGVLMGKKGLAVLAMVFAVTVGGAAWWLSNDRSVVPPPVGDGIATSAPATAEARSRVDDVAATTDVAKSERTAAGAPDRASATPGKEWPLHARVIDGPSQQPIADALVELFGPRTMTLLELQRELADVARPGPRGIPFMWSRDVQLPQNVPVDVQLEGAPHPFLVHPAPGSTTLADTRTASDGSFDLVMPSGGGVLAVTAEGRATRYVAFANAPEKEESIVIWPTSRITGHVRTDHDEVPPTPIALLLRSGDGVWTTTTDANGAFTVDAAIDFAMVESRTPGWAVTRERVLKNGQRWIDDITARPDRENTIWIRRFGGAQLHVTDVETGAPIEQISLQSFDQHRTPQHGGRFFARDRRFTLDVMGPEERLMSPHATVTAPSRLTVSVWAEGYAPFTRDGIELYAQHAEVVEAKLRRGDLPRVTGLVLQSGAPVAGARLLLQPRNPFGAPSEDQVVASRTSSAGGRFELSAPAGDYVCTVHIGERLEAQLPLRLREATEALTVELNDSIQLDVQVLDAEGRPCADHDVRAIGVDGWQRLVTTDAAGHAVIEPFAPGKITVDAPLVATHTSWSPVTTETVEATAGSRPQVTLRLPSARPFRISLAFRGEAPAAGFAGFTAAANGQAPVAVEPSGAVPLDFVRGWPMLQVDGPDGRRWDIQLPDESRDGDVVTIGWRGPALRGIVVNERGKPFVGRVHAIPQDRSGTVSTTTAADGSFRIDGLAACAHTLRFSSEGQQHLDPLDRYGTVAFRPTALPAPEPTLLHISLVGVTENAFDGLENVVVRGRVTDAAGDVARDAWVSVKGLLAQDGGDLEMGLRASFQSCDADGRYCITVPRAASHRFSVARKGVTAQSEIVTLPDAAEVQRDFVLR